MKAKELRMLKQEAMSRMAQVIMGWRETMRAWFDANPSTIGCDANTSEHLLTALPETWLDAWFSIVHKEKFSGKAVVLTVVEHNTGSLQIVDFNTKKALIIATKCRTSNQVFGETRYGYARSGTPANHNNFNKIVDKIMLDLEKRIVATQEKRAAFNAMPGDADFKKKFAEAWLRIEFDIMANDSPGVGINKKVDDIVAKMSQAFLGKAAL